MAIPNSKVCSICKLDKSSEDYSTNNGKLRSACKDCSNRIKREKRTIARQLKEEQILLNTSTIEEKTQLCLLCKQEKKISEFEIILNKLRKNCIECYDNSENLSSESIKKELKREARRKKYHEQMQDEEFKEARRIKMKKIYDLNKDAINKQHKEYRESNKEKEKERHAKYYQKNKSNIHSYRRNYYTNNPMKKLMLKLRQRLSKYYISGRECPDLLNCDMEFLRKWFSFNFELDKEKSMNFSNHGSYWHIDHVIPCCYFDVSNLDHRKLCFSWYNLRPLLANENSEKNGNIDEIYITEQNFRLKEFCEKENIPLKQITLFKSRDTSIAGTSLELSTTTFEEVTFQNTQGNDLGLCSTINCRTISNNVKDWTIRSEKLFIDIHFDINKYPLWN